MGSASHVKFTHRHNTLSPQSYTPMPSLNTPFPRLGPPRKLLSRTDTANQVARNDPPLKMHGFCVSWLLWRTSTADQAICCKSLLKMKGFRFFEAALTHSHAKNNLVNIRSTLICMDPKAQTHSSPLPTTRTAKRQGEQAPINPCKKTRVQHRRQDHT